MPDPCRLGTLSAMGFLDKVKGAVTTAKAELDKSGILDQLRGDEDDARGAAPASSGFDPTYAMVESIRRGAVDPRPLISRAEVEHLAGRTVGEGRLGFNGDFVGVTFDGPGVRVALQCFHNMDDDAPWNADEQWEWLEEHVDRDEARVLTDLGDDGYVQGSSAYVKAVGRVLYADVTIDKHTEDARGRIAEAVLRAAVPRLPTS